MKIYRTVSLKLSFKHSVTLTEGQETARHCHTWWGIVNNFDSLLHWTGSGV